MFNNYKINKTHNVKKTYYNFNGDITLNKTSNNYSNDTYNIIKTNHTFNTTGNQYFTKKINSTSTISDNVTRHNHNNCEHNLNHYFTHQRKGNNESAVQALSIIVADLQTQINNLNSGSGSGGGGGGDPDGIGTA